LSGTHDELLLVELGHGLARADNFVHERLRERRLVQLVVAPSPVGDQIQDDVLAELVAVLERDLDRPCDFLQESGKKKVSIK
jgi:transcriptional regulator GlxA family with amidase domain